MMSFNNGYQDKGGHTMHIEPLQQPLRLSYRYNHNYQMDIHSHPLYEIYYFHEGRCNFIIGSQIHVLQPGDLILMHGLTLHSSNPDPRVEYVRSNIHFDPVHIRSLLNQCVLTNAFQPIDKLGNLLIHLGVEQQGEMDSLLRRMLHFRSQDDESSAYRFLLAFLDLLYFIYPLCLNSHQQQQNSVSNKELHVQRMITYLGQYYAEDLDMDILKREMFLNKTYLSKIFKEVTGMTIFYYLKKLRLNQANILFLLQPQLSVSEVCFKVGFKQISHFSRLFKQEFSCTPEEYRKKTGIN